MKITEIINEGMNARIQQLADKARLGLDDPSINVDSRIEKFAELIVQECMVIASEMPINKNEISNALELVKQHFKIK